MAAQKPEVQLRSAGGIQYELYRKKIKQLHLRVRDNGTVMVSIPLRTSLEQADAFVCKNAQWIHDTRQKVMAKAARDNADLPDKATALACFTAMSDQVYPAFAGVLGGQKPTLKVRSMTTRWGVCCPGKKQITLRCSCITCRLRRRSMWWCTNTATFCRPTTARRSGPRWQSCCRTGKPGGSY